MKLDKIEVVVIKGDITQSNTEAIVNAANNKFFMGGGVAGAIKKAGGKVIEDEALKQGPVEVGEAILTSAGRLKARYVIHAATMKMDFKTDEEIIRKATYSSLLCGQKNKITSVAFCALGCGVGRFGFEAVSKIMAQEVFRYIRQIEEPTLKKIVFVLYSDEAFRVFEKNVVRYLEYMSKKLSAGPFLTVDGIIEYEGGVVMIERSNPPLGWALPGGFVDYGESVEQAIVREVKEETNLNFINFKQFKVCSKGDRDPRFHTVSVVFTGEGKGDLKADSDAKSAQVFKLDSLSPKGWLHLPLKGLLRLSLKGRLRLPEKIVFDHRKIIEDYIKTSFRQP